VNADRPRLHVGHCSDRGRQRELNEDSYLVLATPAVTPEIDGLVAVADGMGGHQAGDVASHMVVKTLDALFSSSAYHQGIAYSVEHADYYVVVLKEVLEQINEEIYERSASRPDLHGMGTTATVALLRGWRLFLGHVGDTRAYLLRDSTLRCLTHDHTWVAEGVRAGKMTWEEAAQHPRRNELTQSLGNSSLVRVERTAEPVQASDLLLLCSDGLHGVVSDVEIGEALRRNPDPQPACEKLVALANERGGPDNITAVAVRLTPSGPRSSISGGRVLGPLQQEAAAQPLADTLKMRRDRHRWRRFVKRLAGVLGMALVLFGGALLSGLAAWLVSLIPSPTRVPLPVVVAVCAFILGALLGWLLRPSGAE
jgi:protein phosphatase